MSTDLQFDAIGDAGMVAWAKTEQLVACKDPAEGLASELLGAFQGSRLRHAIVLQWHRVGSRYTCNPPPQDTDYDILVLCDQVDLAEHLDKLGFEPHGSMHGSTEFTSFKHPTSPLNFIVTESQSFYDKFLLATHVAKKLNLLDKSDRITLFQAILYGRKH